MSNNIIKDIIYSRPIQQLRHFIKPVIYIFFKDLHKKKFRFNGKDYHYFTQGEYNNPWKNERAVEVAIAIDYLKQYKNKNILEVGNVLSNYFPITHDVVDPYDTNPFVIQEDIVLYNPKKKYDLIICISTLEHIGWDMGDDGHGIQPEKGIKAVYHMKQLLKKGGLLLITTPYGYNEYLDSHILQNKLSFTKKYFMKRTSILNYWKEVTTFNKKDLQYDIVVMSPRLLNIGMFYQK
ncbi:MAG TPA: methyltransferase domain-containing protein [Candidatus Woesebacteria bacterium]|nr:methyltransferase domain-containing protein [Candidatus Woesebacteria bacterium]